MRRPPPPPGPGDAVTHAPLWPKHVLRRDRRLERRERVTEPAISFARHLRQWPFAPTTPSAASGAIAATTLDEGLVS